MATILWQRWEEVILGRPIECFGHEGYHNWSKEVTAKGDYRKRSNYGTGFWNWLGKLFFWDRRVVLIPEGLPEVSFYIVFKTNQGLCMASSTTRRIEDGPFMMRIGPRDINFFIVGKDGKVELKIAGYVRGSVDLH